MRWRRADRIPHDAEIATVRRFLWIELAPFAPLPIFAVAMARGYGADTI